MLDDGCYHLTLNMNVIWYNGNLYNVIWYMVWMYHISKTILYEVPLYGIIGTYKWHLLRPWCNFWPETEFQFLTIFVNGERGEWLREGPVKKNYINFLIKKIVVVFVVVVVVVLLLCCCCCCVVVVVGCGWGCGIKSMLSWS